MPDAAPQTNQPVQLAPPRPPMRESFLEAHRPEIAASLALYLILVAVLTAAAVRLTRRMNPPLPEPAGRRARRELEALRSRGADAALSVETARVLRRFAAGQFNLPAGEMTTAELCDALRNSRATPEASGLIADFLKRCDVAKFAPDAGVAETDWIAAAMRLVEQVENAAVPR